MNESLESVEMTPLAGPLECAVRPPGSKSITNRAAVCAALAEGASRLRGALDSEDTQVMVAALRQLGLGAEWDGDVLTIVGGGGGVPRGASDLHVANSGTTIRFLTAMLAACGGDHRLDGVPRMRQRPIADLIDALRQLGADVRSEHDDGCPPVRLAGAGLAGGEAVIRGDISSQFLSGLLMAAPAAQRPVALRVSGPLVSQPYVEMTLQVMRAFGVAVDAEELRAFQIEPQSYRAADYAIEPDASAASYFWGAAAIVGGSVTVEGLSFQALQGDVQFCECLRQMGCRADEFAGGIRVRSDGRLRGVTVDMNGISDTVQTLAAAALFAEGPTTISGVAHIRHKETDRIGDLARELRKLGAAVEEQEDGLTIHPPRAVTPAAIDTYNDHRMAMSLSLVGLRASGVVINNPRCTEKTYPAFFSDLEKLR